MNPNLDSSNLFKTKRFVMHTAAYYQYISLLNKLKELISAAPDDSPEVDALRDEMDPLWFQLSESERAEINKNVKFPPAPVIER